MYINVRVIIMFVKYCEWFAEVFRKPLVCLKHVVLFTIRVI